MKLRRGYFLALSAAFVVGACAPAGDPAAGPTAGGTRPTETQFTRTAKLQIAQAEGAPEERRQQLYQTALEQSMQGIEANPNNPQHHYLAGLSAAGLGRFEDADRHWDRALEIYPGYQAEIEGAREKAWVQAFNEAVQAYNAGDMDAAIRGWQHANMIFDRRPEAFFNLAAVYSQQEQYDRAIDMFRDALTALDREPGRELSPEETAERDESRVQALQNLGQLLLFRERYGEAEEVFRRWTEAQPTNIQAQSNLAVVLARQGRRDDALATYQRLLATPNVSFEDVFNVGVGLFQIEEYGRAADAFRRATEMNPHSRDALFNYVNALYAQERWNDLIQPAERLLQMDPLNENAHLILVRAYRDTRQQQQALRIAERNQATPVHLQDLQLRTTEGRSTITATVTPSQARQGTPVRLQFTFFGADGQELGRQTVTVTAPAAGATANLNVVLQNATPATGYRYEVLR